MKAYCRECDYESEEVESQMSEWGASVQKLKDDGGSRETVWEGPGRGGTRLRCPNGHPNVKVE